MKVRKLGLEWGAAYEEAEPIKISHNYISVTVYIAEDGDLVIELPPDCQITWQKDGFKAQIPNE